MDRVRKELEINMIHKRGTRGMGVNVCVLDTGISPHYDFTYPVNRIVGFYDVINRKREPYDDNGHGTHIAGIIGGNGVGSEGKYCGMAPECGLVGVKVLDSKGNGSITNVIAGIKWILENQQKYNIRLVNISLGNVKGRNFGEESVLVQMVNRLWDQGIVVVCAAGNSGPKAGSIGAPGNSRKVITVGISEPASFQPGNGPTRVCVQKPDVVAPGNNIWCCYVTAREQHQYIPRSGTSMSTPIVTGALALLLCKYPSMTNLEVKLRIRNTSKDLGLSHAKQGWGKIDVRRLLL